MRIKTPTPSRLDGCDQTGTEANRNSILGRVPAMTFEPYCKNLVYIIVVHYRMFSTLLIRVPIVLMLPVFIFDKKKKCDLEYSSRYEFSFSKYCSRFSS